MAKRRLIFYNKTLGQIEPHLMAENGARADAGAVGLRNAGVEDESQEIEIGAHG